MICLAEKMTMLEASLKAADVVLQVRDSIVKSSVRKSSKVLFTKQVDRLERKLTKAIAPLFVKQIEVMAERLHELSGEKAVAANMVDQIFDPNDFKEALIEVMLPIMAVEMLRAAKLEADQIKADTVEFRR